MEPLKVGLPISDVMVGVAQEDEVNRLGYERVIIGAHHRKQVVEPFRARPGVEIADHVRLDVYSPDATERTSGGEADREVAGRRPDVSDLGAWGEVELGKHSIGHLVFIPRRVLKPFRPDIGVVESVAAMTMVVLLHRSSCALRRGRLCGGHRAAKEQEGDEDRAHRLMVVRRLLARLRPPERSQYPGGMAFEHHTQTYGSSGPLAVQVSSMERMAFLKKVYSLFGMALSIFALTAWWGTVSPTGQAIWASVLGTHWLAYLGIVLGSMFLLRLVAHRYPLNLLMLGLFAAIMGLFTAPLLVFTLVSNPDAGPTIIAQAGTLTAVVFAGLTLYTLTSRRDFSFMGAGLWVGFAILFGFGLLGMLFGWDTSGWGVSLAWVLLMAGFVVYDTSNIMRRYPTNMAVAAACAIFIDVVILFQRLLMLLNRRR